jgi:hypothetical protein
LTKEQLFEVMNILQNTYSNFNFDQEKLDIWFRYLKGQNPAVVMKNVDRWVVESQFPPTIADLREVHHPAYNSNIIQQIEQWETEVQKERANKE